MSSESNPPFYILLAHSSLSNTPTGAPSSTLFHPSIQYHYNDDSPLSLLPNSPDEHVLVLNFDPQNNANSSVQSISDNLAATQLRLEEAPGAAAMEESGVRNDNMFIIETVSNDHSLSASQSERPPAQASLAQFKHRNGAIRRVLQYPSSSPSQVTPQATPQLK